MPVRNYLILILVTCVGLLTGCQSTEIKSTKLTPVVKEQGEIPEAELLDVGIRIFDPGIDDIDKDESAIVFPEIRIAESNYFPYLLVKTIEKSAAWGSVRVVPKNYDAIDVMVQGQIKQSNGELLTMHVVVNDSQGKTWFSKDYQQMASRYAYDRRSRNLKQEPFQNIYNQIANDMLQFQRQLSSKQRIALHQISELKFAHNFAPERFAGYITKNPQGYYQIQRLPSEQDEMMVRVNQIRERDYLFIDTLQEYYANYAKEMQQPYQQWRTESYQEVISLRNMKRQARNQKMIGAAAIIAGIIGAGNSSGSARAASSVAIAGGGYVLKDGFDRDDEAQIHVDAIQELGDSFEASIGEHVIQLEDRTVTLSGTVDDQYQQWRAILKDIYQLDYQTP